MKINNFQILTLFIIVTLFPIKSWAENKLNTDGNYSIKIAVTVNDNDNIFGKIEYSNQEPQYPLQLVTFVRMGETIYSEPYLFELLEKEIISPNLHRIKCRNLNGKYSYGVLFGTIDFRDETKPKIKLVNEGGATHISNISGKGEKLHSQLIPNVWLGN